MTSFISTGKVIASLVSTICAEMSPNSRFVRDEGIKMKTHLNKTIWSQFEQYDGRIGPPLLLWILGVPTTVCVLLWLFFFRG